MMHFVIGETAASALTHAFRGKDNQFMHQEETYRHSLDKLKRLKDGDQITIWTCENAAEQIGMHQRTARQEFGRRFCKGNSCHW